MLHNGKDEMLAITRRDEDTQKSSGSQRGTKDQVSKSVQKVDEDQDARRTSDARKRQDMQSINQLRPGNWLSHSTMEMMFRSVLPPDVRFYDVGNLEARMLAIHHKGERMYICLVNTGNHWTCDLIDLEQGVYVIDPLQSGIHTRRACTKATDIMQAFPNDVPVNKHITIVPFKKVQNDDYNCGIFVFVACLQLIGAEPNAVGNMSIEVEDPDIWREVMFRFLSDPAAQDVQPLISAGEGASERLQMMYESLTTLIPTISDATRLRRLAEYVDNMVRLASRREISNHLPPTACHDHRQQLQSVLELPPETLSGLVSSVIENPTVSFRLATRAV